MGITKLEGSYLSAEGKTQIHTLSWIPEKTVRAIVQIVHGMVEFLERYDDFARYLCDRGILVVGSDLLGHGASVIDPGQRGHLEANRGADYLIADMHALRGFTQEKHPSVPYFLFGHSMGSFLVRDYLPLHGEGLAGAIICGTGTQPKLMLKGGKFVTDVMAAVKGYGYRSLFVENLGFGAYNKRIDSPRTKSDWLTKDEKIVDAYIADERSGFLFTLGGYHELFSLIERACAPKTIEQTDPALPLFFISGAEDPVGNYGKGVLEAVLAYERRPHSRVRFKLYEGDRHEILNETDRKTVYRDIFSWIDEVVNGTLREKPREDRARHAGVL